MNDIVLCIKGINQAIELKENVFSNLIIENKDLLFSILNELSNQVLEDYILIYSDNEPINFSEIDFVFDFFNLDINNKKNENALTKRLGKYFLQDDISLQINTINEQIIKLFKEKLLNFDLSLTFREDIFVNDYFKFLNIRLNDESESFIEKLVCYIKATYVLRKISIYIFYGIRFFLTGEDLEKLYNELKYYHFIIIFIENSDKYILNSFEKKVIIDKQLVYLN